MRVTGSVKAPLNYELIDKNPVLFPEYGNNKVLNQRISHCNSCNGNFDVRGVLFSRPCNILFIF